MTIQEIKRNLQQTEEMINEMQFKKKQIEEQVYELQLLRKKLAVFREQFNIGLQRRKRTIRLYNSRRIRNRIFSRYLSGMEEIVGGIEARNAQEGLEESERRMKKQMNKLERKRDECERQILHQKKRRDYWRRQWAMSIQKEG